MGVLAGAYVMDSTPFGNVNEHGATVQLLKHRQCSHSGIGGCSKLVSLMNVSGAAKITQPAPSIYFSELVLYNCVKQ